MADAAVRGAPKCFQVWLHRRRVLERLLLLEKEEGNPSSSRRLLLLREDLEWSWQGLVGVNGSSGDPKNVHAWSHRRWVLDQAMLQLEEEGEGEQRAVRSARDCIHMCCICVSRGPRNKINISSRANPFTINQRKAGSCCRAPTGGD